MQLRGVVRSLQLLSRRGKRCSPASWGVSDPAEETQREVDVPRFHSRRNQGPSMTIESAPWRQSLSHGGIRLLQRTKKQWAVEVGSEREEGTEGVVGSEVCLEEGEEKEGRSVWWVEQVSTLSSCCCSAL